METEAQAEIPDKRSKEEQVISRQFSMHSDAKNVEASSGLSGAEAALKGLPSQLESLLWKPQGETWDCNGTWGETRRERGTLWWEPATKSPIFLCPSSSLPKILTNISRLQKYK